jgi:predicted lipoprotein with Yx(FWY)xxD motif
MSRVGDALIKGGRWVFPVAAVAALGVVSAVAVAALARPTTVTTHQTKRGKVLSAASGHSLYMLSTDKAGKSGCTGSCSNSWLPLLTSSRPAAAEASGVNAKLLGTIKRSNHALQVTYNGHPLYLFSRDKSAGEISGEGASQFGGHWYVVNTGGNAVKPKPSGGGGVCNPVCQGY